MSVKPRALEKPWSEDHELRPLHRHQSQLLPLTSVYRYPGQQRPHGISEALEKIRIYYLTPD